MSRARTTGSVDLGPKTGTAELLPQPGTRELIVRRAAELFAEKGYSNTSLDDIAAGVGIKKPSLYHYIRTKEDLLYEIQQVLVEELFSEVNTLLDTATTPEEKVRAYFRAVLRLIARRKVEMVVYINESTARPVSGRLRKLGAKQDELQKMFEDVLSDGMADGVFRDLPPTLTALATLGSVSWAYRWYEASGSLPPDDVADLFVDIVLNGIAV
jgi:TetR/AcrR family transcriptional regulator, cholesterol catabolism regulator